MLIYLFIKQCWIRASGYCTCFPVIWKKVLYLLFLLNIENLFTRNLNLEDTAFLLFSDENLSATEKAGEVDCPGFLSPNRIAYTTSF